MKIKQRPNFPLRALGPFLWRKKVIITLVEEKLTDDENDWQRLFAAIEENQIDADITDLAHNHDHYLYGTPKRKD